MKSILTKLFGEAVTDEALSEFNAELGKKFVAKADYNAKLEIIRSLESDNETMKNKITELSENASSAEDYKKEIDNLKQTIKDRDDADKARQADAELTAAIEAVLGDKKFTSEYARAGIIADMKTEIAKPENKGKGYTEILDVLTKDKEGIFANPNPPANMPGMGYVSSDIGNLENLSMTDYIAARKKMKG